MDRKVSSLIKAIQSGRQPGCLKDGFDASPLFDQLAHNVANAYIDKFNEIDNLSSKYDAVKSAWKSDICAERKPSDFDIVKIASFSDKIDISALSQALQQPDSPDAAEAKRKKIDAIRVFCNSAMQAGNETFGSEWRGMGAEDRSSLSLMALRPTWQKHPELKPILAKILETNDNIFTEALHGQESECVMSYLKQLAFEEPQMP